MMCAHCPWSDTATFSCWYNTVFHLEAALVNAPWDSPKVCQQSTLMDEWEMEGQVPGAMSRHTHSMHAVSHNSAHHGTLHMFHKCAHHGHARARHHARAMHDSHQGMWHYFPPAILPVPHLLQEVQAAFRLVHTAQQPLLLFLTHLQGFA